MSARERQLAAAKVLMALLSEDLPVASWTLYDVNATLNGQISVSGGTVEQRLMAVQKWADYLGAEITVTRYEKRTGGSVSVTGEIDGVRIYVWSAFPKKELPKTPKAGA
ncbi:hypothetical protein ACQEVF_32680 [Nonomuraea polychroma]|uniref:hypothetical protein n=1 Tax=Nonomuraea polychroma TaxID=46176 RepID=UPI003D909D6F